MIASGNRRRVVVTGVGVINPLGNDIETVWSAIKEGKSGVGYTTIFDAGGRRPRWRWCTRACRCCSGWCTRTTTT